MTLVLFALSRYLVVLLLCMSAYFIGHAVLQRLTFTTLAERLFLCIAFGLGVLSHLILMIGLLGWLTLAGVALVMAAATAVSILICLRRTIPNKKPDRTVRPLWLWWIVGIAFLIVVGVALFSLWLLPLYPPTDFDVTMYHFAAPKAWMRDHAITATPFLRGPILPHTAHALFAALMLAKDDLAAQMLSVAGTGLIGVGLYAWGKRLHGLTTGLFAVALWIGSPAVLALAGVGSYHILGSLFAFAAIYALGTYATTRQLNWLFAAGAFVGFAQSAWSMTSFFVPITAVACLYFVYKERRITPLYAVTAGALLGWGPALLRATWYTGNPTFPLLTEVFGTGPWWTKQDVASMANDIHRFGLPRTVMNLLSIPYALVVHPDKFQAAQGYSVVLSIMLPAVVLRSIRDKCVRWLAITVLFYVACWFVFGQIMRYLLPIVPLLCVITAVSTAWIADRITQARRAVSTGLIALAAAGSLIPGFLYARNEIASRGPVPMTIEARAAYIVARIPEYAALTVANVAPGPVYSLFGTNCAYYSDGPFMGDFFGPGRYSQVLDSLRDGETLYATLHRLGAKYFLVSSADGAPLLPNDREFDRHFEPIFANSAAAEGPDIENHKSSHSICVQAHYIACWRCRRAPGRLGRPVSRKESLTCVTFMESPAPSSSAAQPRA